MFDGTSSSSCAACSGGLALCPASRWMSFSCLVGDRASCEMCFIDVGLGFFGEARGNQLPIILS